MRENTEYWDKLKVTDPKHTKGFSRAGGFKGTAIKPQWVVQRMTEEFGPVGIGWGMGAPSFQVVEVGDEVLVYATVTAWFESRTNSIVGVGGDKVATKRSSGVFVDDEAFKKAYTDALMNAFKFLGVGADVHMGLFDDSKYVQQAAEAHRPAPKPSKQEDDDGKQKKINTSVQPEGEDWWGAVGAGPSAYSAKNNGMGDRFEAIRNALFEAKTVDAWQEWAKTHSDEIKTFPRGWRIQLRNDAEEAKSAL